jgi:hypothetical protein
MPVIIPSLSGKVPHEVERALRDLADAINRMEGHPRAAEPVGLASLSAKVEQIATQVKWLVSRAED